MRTFRTLDVLMPRTRQAILAETVLHPDRWWYLADLARQVGVTPSSLQRDLAALTGAGILRSRRDGNRTYYQPDPACPILPDLHGLLTKTAGIVDVLRDALAPFADGITIAFVYGSVAAGTETSESDADLMVVGSVQLGDIVVALRGAERTLLRPVNASVYSAAEFSAKLAGSHPFLLQVMESDRLVVLGADNALESLAR